MFIVLLQHCDIIAKSNFMNVFSVHEGIILAVEMSRGPSLPWTVVKRHRMFIYCVIFIRDFIQSSYFIYKCLDPCRGIKYKFYNFDFVIVFQISCYLSVNVI
jgi:hypothetical protein